MPPIPAVARSRAVNIRSLLDQGRAEEAMKKLVDELKNGNADTGVQKLAAEWIGTLGIRPGDAKDLRKGRPKIPKHWPEIVDMVEGLTPKLSKSEAVIETAEHFGCSDRTVWACLRWYEEASSD